MESVHNEFCQKVNQAFKRIPSTLPNFTLHAVKYFLWNFDNPQKSYKIVHVAGTNGKGSVSIKTAALLRKSGYKVGLFTSPHISSVRERIRLNLELIPEEEFIKYYDICEKFETELEITLGFFQVTLCMALLYFQQENCDYVILECGIGGLSSSTNVVDSDFAVITSIGLDHKNVLGVTEKHICRDKAGIIRQNIPFVVGPTIPLDIIEPICKIHNSKLVVVDEKNENFVTLNQSISYALYKEIIEVAEEVPHELNQEEIDLALDVNLPCRMDLIPIENVKDLAPGLDFYPKASYMDVAHNSPAFKSLFKTVLSIYKDFEDLVIYVICTFSKDKEISESLKALCKGANDIRIVVIKHFKLIKEDAAIGYISQAKSSESPDTEKINDLYEKGDLKENVIATLNKINELKHENAILLHCGSVFLMEFIKDLYKVPQEKDLENLNSQV
ncbi:unnamed protein product [Moneuplotes crassus]|uniref:Uncharacterized protein n=1 Tax=Euplotes crassus TaxID=5936 RepID=A0AAD1UHP0_EUPCR|nr:unnamed protein product [Moneuplotes crassus]